MLAKYGVQEEKKILDEQLLTVEPARQSRGDRYDGEGDTDVDGLCHASFKLFIISRASMKH